MRGCKRKAEVVIEAATYNDPGGSIPKSHFFHVKDWDAFDGTRMCRSHSKAEADRLWSLKVRERGSCEAAWVNDGNVRATPVGFACGGVLQAAHGFPRTYAHTRYLLLNGFCICAGHHRWFTSKPLEWSRFMAERIGADAYYELRGLALSTSEPRPIADVLAELRATG